MKVSVTMKCPDALYEALEVVTWPALDSAEIDEEEAERIKEERRAALRAVIAEKWMEYGEYLTVEFDTEAMTATVIPEK